MREAGFEEVRRVIREEEPPLPSHRLSTLDAEAISTITAHRGVDARRLGRLLRGDLDWIVMKALEKDRSRRYESASAFAADVEHYLANESGKARPPSLADHVAKWARRHRPVVWSASAILLVGLLVLALSPVLITRAYTQATIDRATAEANLQAALDVLNDLSKRLESELAGIPELDQSRREILEELLTLYLRPKKQNEKDTEVRVAIGKALQRLSGTCLGLSEYGKAVEWAGEAVARF